jgi:hypothetical protein
MSILVIAVALFSIKLGINNHVSTWGIVGLASSGVMIVTAIYVISQAVALIVAKLNQEEKAFGVCVMMAFAVITAGILITLTPVAISSKIFAGSNHGMVVNEEQPQVSCMYICETPSFKTIGSGLGR